ncbi:Type I restriction modification DNA specificity domain protein [Streptococcus mitis]|uniref:Type I restriction modification DNA specificity domain protein n=2 Tax=Streptococcus TaxID=1301 RepID=F9P249_STROR|nr:type I restriction modification DNA specificity domain protein [Streptococcus mitis bv. 2 str. F0392]RSJ03946.1 Type I restriction modification DNA specificity domain protein [Streptococcus mitis]
MCKRILKSQTNEFSGIPFYKISTFGGTPTVYIDEKIYREYKERYSYPKKGDILISAAGTIGKTVIFDGEDSYFQDSNIVWIENDESKVTNQFLYYFLQTNPFITTNGSTIKRLYNDNLRDTKIPNVPSIQQQNQITDILGALDKKIQTNNQINQELEAMAKTLYDYWFVQFDFPDQNGKPYKSSGGKMVYHPELKREIPEGWGVEKLDSLLKIGKETTNPMKFPNEEFKYYSIPEFDTTGTYSLELGESIKSNKFKVEKNDLLVSKLNPWFNRVIYNLEENAISSTEFIVWKTFNRFEKNFLYQVATGKEFIEYCTRFATGTSNSHKRVSPDIMIGFQSPFEKTYIQKFGEIIDSIRTQVLQNNEQNQELTQLRDWLLPMLMNGQVTVE